MKGKVSLVASLALLVAVIAYLTSDQEAPMIVYDLNNPQTPVMGVLTGGQPSEEDFRKLRDEGYETVINLRLPSEFDGFDEGATVEELGMRYISLPINVRSDLNEANAAKLGQLIADADGLTLVHCGSGDRVGALYALQALYANGQSVDQAIVVGRSAGLNRLEDLVRGMLNAGGN